MFTIFLWQSNFSFQRFGKIKKKNLVFAEKFFCRQEKMDEKKCKHCIRRILNSLKRILTKFFLHPIILQFIENMKLKSVDDYSLLFIYKNITVISVLKVPVNFFNKCLNSSKIV